jgi:hypothetical protein
LCVVAACGGDDESATAGSTGGTAGSGGGAAGARSGAGGVNDAGEERSEEGGVAGSGGQAEAGADGSDESSTDVTSSETASDGLVSAPDGPDSAAEGSGMSDTSPESDAASSSPRVCAELCSVDDDCARDSGIQRFLCHPATHHCSTCLDDMICIATRSFWTAKTCTADFDCVNEGGFAPFGDVCIDVIGGGSCAFLATSTSNCTSTLNTATFSTFNVKKYGSDERVDVCGKPSRCDADRGSCQNPCTSNTSCTPARGGKVCNVGLGKCECGSDGDCGPGAPTCNLVLKQCECASPSDCSADTGRTLTCQ